MHIKNFYNPKKIRLQTFKTLKKSYGKLTLIELKDLPFKVQRVFFSYNVKKNFQRGGHAHKKIFNS